MPINSSITSLIAAPILQKTTEQLKHVATVQLSNLLRQEKKIIQMESNLDILMARYQVGKSIFSRMADWYGARPWWMQTLIGIAFITLSSLIAIFFQVTLIVSVLSVASYAGASMLLLNHYKLHSKRDQRFCDDILEMEKILSQTISELNELHQQLTKVFISLSEENVRLASDTLAFENQIALLTQQVTDFTRTIAELTSTNELLQSSNHHFRAHLEDMNSELKTAQTTLIEKTTKLAQVHTQLVESNSNLLSSANQMVSLEKRFQQNVDAICLLKENLQTQLTMFSTQVMDHKRKKDEVRLAIQGLHDEACLENTSCDEFITRHTETIKPSLKRYETLKTKDEQMAAEIIMQSHETHLLLAVVASERAARQARVTRDLRVVSDITKIDPEQASHQAIHP